MQICIKIGGETHCFVVPVIEIPVKFPHPGPGPVNFPQLFQDATLIASAQSMASHVSDDGVRGALQRGIQEATKALQARGGAHVSVKDEPGKGA